MFPEESTPTSVNSSSNGYTPAPHTTDDIVPVLNSPLRYLTITAYELAVPTA